MSHCVSGGGFSGFAFDPGWSNVPPGYRNPEEKPGGFLVIYVVATLTIKPETRAEFIAAATACIRETRKEPGNIAYDLHESVTDPAKMVFVEQWESAEALVPHRGQEHMKTFGRVAVKCFTAPPKIEVITPEKVETR
ncbi:quinol monooxygenase YgiN [Bradyrhizobium sp. USDA 4472]